MSDISPSTGDPYYSGDWQNIKDVCRALNMGDGKLSKITQELVNRFQERVDREIDGNLQHVYYTPLSYYNQVMPDGNTKSIFPGNARTMAIYLTAAQLLQSEFQGNEPNAQEAANQYMESAKKMLFAIQRFNVRLEGQDFKSPLRTMPPTFQPPVPPEAN